ncbi:MAG: FAD-dependent oxidoreductase [Segetibacter sp.]|nr:FAD-dependent oxidoreductase [Segetibacter sp.]
MKVIIVGAGAAGLMAAKVLLENKVEVVILEARDRTGGRIFPIVNNKYGFTVQGGAEFVHGKLPVTLELLEEAGLTLKETTGKFLQLKNGMWQQSWEMIEDQEKVIEKMKGLKEDMPVAIYLETYFNDDQHKAMRESLCKYVEGYDAADPATASTLAFLKEWETEEDEQYRIEGGYGKLLDFIVDKINKAGANIIVDTVVKNIEWTTGDVTVTTAKNEKISADKIIVTVPLGVLTSPPGSPAHIKFYPALPAKIEAAGKIGSGFVIKVLLWFNDAFWEDGLAGNFDPEIKDAAFLISSETIPTWWTQLPDRSPLLTGWLAGPKAATFKDANEAEILQLAIDSLAKILNVSHAVISEKLLWSKVINWPADPFAVTAYHFETVETATAQAELATPVNDTIYFAGEAIHNGQSTATVESALTSGKITAELICKSLSK